MVLFPSDQGRITVVFANNSSEQAPIPAMDVSKTLDQNHRYLWPHQRRRHQYRTIDAAATNTAFTNPHSLVSLSNSQFNPFRSSIVNRQFITVTVEGSFLINVAFFNVSSERNVGREGLPVTLSAYQRMQLLPECDRESDLDRERS
ncbi:hypothetical protein L2E82_38995 [Cichorium intybus]|uniref:Uncharacterized protein n=1 Tax=Cichorium intybus TaxID=13427 RepID=A0ACB9AGZ7_CICIN|nr:hypothetical protein L2E82_38995 [Cichorium intybus]